MRVLSRVTSVGLACAIAPFLVPMSAQGASVYGMAPAVVAPDGAKLKWFGQASGLGCNDNNVNVQTDVKSSILIFTTSGLKTSSHAEDRLSDCLLRIGVTIPEGWRAVPRSAVTVGKRRVLKGGPSVTIYHKAWVAGLQPSSDSVTEFDPVSYGGWVNRESYSGLASRCGRIATFTLSYALFADEPKDGQPESELSVDRVTVSLDNFSWERCDSDVA